ncbi:hypothetical protein DNFV4_03685 [Nitrospira tepida]|uniref:Uncharacterized protein n=1 Tax=Nitrospira tepida TaxID=2973512 RepID=A0AA86N235_9BACT|nr:hypothetical protein DNFV4_03685 [Nitrospira tepida]
MNTYLNEQPLRIYLTPQFVKFTSCSFCFMESFCRDLFNRLFVELTNCL